MRESVLNALLQLFALVTETTEQQSDSLAHAQVKAFLAPRVAPDKLEDYLGQFDDYLRAFHKPARPDSEKSARKKSSLSSVKVLMLCEEINEELMRPEKITVLIRLIEFVHKGGRIAFRETGFLHTLTRIFNIDESVYLLIDHFVTGGENDHDQLLYISAQSDAKRKLVRREMAGQLVAHVLPESGDVYVRYQGSDLILLNNETVEPGTVYQMERGSLLFGKQIGYIYQSELLQHYFRADFSQHILFEAREITHQFSDGSIGLHPMNLLATSGQLIGMMGASGAGKSTLLNVLNGNLPAHTGSIAINGMETASREAKKWIGYVPQDDLLIEELTVFENLYYNGKLCLPRLEDDELTARIDRLLERIDLHTIRNLRVGSVLDKLISGGQRKRLNIALELLREPAVLFVDEPTSGLSSQDSEMVMGLLRQLTFKGQLVFAVIHQPSLHLYKLLDRLILLDKGGRLVYNNHPMTAPAWFRERAGYVDATGQLSKGAAYADPDEMLRILEAREVDEFGRRTQNRVRTPQEWYDIYRQQKSTKHTETPQISGFSVQSEAQYNTPGVWEQFAVYFARNLKSKLRNRSYMVIALLEVPVLAAMIGYFTRYAAGTNDDPGAYLLYYNKNLPAFLFMSIVVAIFVGLQISAEEIIRDRKILKRESFLNLSRFSYLNSKVLYLVILSAIQAVLLVLIGNLWMGIEGLWLTFLAILFPTFIFANLLGLNISSALKSVVTIYILVPFLVVPQLLLSGVIVDFDTLQSPEKQGQGTPVVANIMVSRWAYEALAVGHFKRNKFNQHFFEYERDKNEALFMFSLRIPKLQAINEQSEELIGKEDRREELVSNLNLLRDEVEQLQTVSMLKFSEYEKLAPENFNTLTSELLGAWLREMERIYRKHWQTADDRIRATHAELDEIFAHQGGATALMEKHHNEKLENHLRNQQELQKLREVNGRLIRKADYIYQTPSHPAGGAPFYSPVKRLGNQLIETSWFNIGVIWAMNLLLYAALLGNWLKKFLRWTSRLGRK